MQELQEIVHKLYGGCCYCGVPALREAAANLDVILQRKQFSCVEGATATLLDRVMQLQQWAQDKKIDKLWE